MIRRRSCVIVKKKKKTGETNKVVFIDLPTIIFLHKFKYCDTQ